MSGAEHSDAYAKEIYQDLLERIARAYETNDFEAYSKMIRIPHEVSSYAPKVTLRTQGDLRKLFDNIRSNLAQMGITGYERTCVSASFVSCEEIIGTHETRMFSGTHLVDRPYPVQSILRLIDNVWWVCRSDNAIEPENSIARALSKLSQDRKDISDPNLH